MDTTTTISLMQAAWVLGISMQETQRLVRKGQLAVARVVNKVKFLDASSVLAYIKRTQLEAA